MTSRPALPGVEDLYPLTPMQQGMLFEAAHRPGSPAHHEQFTFLLRGELDADALRRAWQLVVDRHAALRTQFVWREVDRPLQVVRKKVMIPWSEQDWRGLDQRGQDARLAAFLAEDRQRVFDPASAPLMRVVLARLSEGSHCLIWSFQHILVDAWSVSVMLNELTEAYEALRACQEPALAPAPRFREHLVALSRRDAKRTEAYWRGLLHGLEAPTEVPSVRDRAESAGRPSSLQTASMTVEGADFDRLKAFTRASRFTMSTVVQGAWGLLLARYAGADDVVFGATVAGRPADLPGVEGMVGLMMNPLPVRALIPAGGTVAAYLGAIQAQSRESSRFDEASASDLQRWSSIPAGTALYDSVVVFGNYPLDEGRRGRIGTIALESPKSYGWTTVPLTLMVTPGRLLDVEARFDGATVDPARLSTVLGHFRNLILSISADSGADLDSVAMLDAAERQRVVAACNRTARQWEGPETVPALFERQAAATPGAVAYRCAGASITYADLNARSAALAGRLAATGVTPDCAVGVCVEPSLHLPVALLGVLRAGAAYVPLDPSYPVSRLEMMVSDSRPSAIVAMRTTEAVVRGFGAPLVFADDAAGGGDRFSPPDLSGDHGAYIIYTSGSTGRPKGVEGLHRGIVNRCRWMWEFRPFAPGEAACWRTTLNFVDSVWEAFGALLSGVATDIMRPETVRDPRALIGALRAGRVTRLVVVPSLLEALLDTEQDLGRLLPDLRLVVTSGEELTGGLARRFFASMPGVELLNLYGSSEVAADATYHVVTQEDARGGRVPIGRPIGNMQALILDDRMHPVPEGVAGTIHIGGAGLARGYHGRADLTAERFIDNPFPELATNRLFRTGDRGRMTAGGVIEFLGRADDQVKVRGSRVELGEVEQAVMACPGVAEAAVVPSGEGGSRRLVAYVVGNNGTLDAAALRAFVRARLPEYMVPSVMVPMPSLPRTPNGKLDRRALVEPDAGGTGHAADRDRPMSEAEASLAAIYREVLGVPSVGLHESFFDLGGHSLLAVKLAARAEAAFKVRLPLATLLASPTVAALAETLTRGGQDAHRAPVVRVRTSGSRTPLFCIHGMDGNVLFLERLARGLSPDQPVYGIQASGMDGVGRPETSVEAMAELYIRAIEEVQAAGPYVLAGYSLGGMVAVEVAHRLAARGDTVSRIILFDTRVPRAAAGRSLKKAMGQRFIYHIKRGPRAFLRSLYLGPVERGSWQLLTRLGLPVPLRLRVWPVRQANLRAYIAHRPRPWAGPITLLRAEHQEDEFKHLPALGWEDFATGELDIRSLPCEHLDFFAGKAAAIVAAELEPILAACAAPSRPVPQADLP
jgi:amino acid adenylation domain-containing protein